MRRCTPISLGVSSFAIVSMALFAAMTAQAATLTVKAGESIQAAVMRAAPGDRIERGAQLRSRFWFIQQAQCRFAETLDRRERVHDLVRQNLQ